ncbi:hypothetical protein VQH23_12750 [Pararoseomonas sp. SCSIO 73927]|uniref:hypothetical protein n=1 Tax=Pararoseomonas sp. SCSIO 73927 TaxID=3114537 RepID=UPI0030CDD3DE
MDPDDFSRIPGDPDRWSRLHAVSRLTESLRIPGEISRLNDIQALQKRIDLATGADLQRRIASSSGDDFRKRLGLSIDEDIRKRFGALSELNARWQNFGPRGATAFAESLSVVRDLAGAGYPKVAEALVSPPAYDLAIQAAQRAEAFRVPAYLEAFRPTSELLASRLALGSLVMPDYGVRLESAGYLDSFVRAASVGSLLSSARTIDLGIEEVVRQVSEDGLDDVETSADARVLLDASGLEVPPWAAERLSGSRDGSRSRNAQDQRSGILQVKFASSRPAAHVIEAVGFVHQTEATLRWAIDVLMTDAYGPDWARVRLPRCKARNLLKRWKDRAGSAGDALVWADWADYALIMCDPEHHARVFSSGFPNVEVLRRLIRRGGDLRGASVHVRSFEPQHLLDLRLVWASLETGLALLVPPEIDEVGFGGLPS